MNFYDLYVRPVTPWKLSCDEASDVKRNVMYLLNNAEKEDMQKISKNTVKSLLASVNTIRSRTNEHESSSA